MTRLINPQPLFLDVSGALMDGGYLYVGVADSVDPRTAPLELYADEALVIPLDQPLRTSGGVITDNTLSPAQVYFAETAFSVRIEDASHVLVYANARINAGPDVAAFLAALLQSETALEAIAAKIDDLANRYPHKPDGTYSDIAAGYERALIDLRRAYFDPFGDTASGFLPRIRPSDGSGGPNTGLTTLDTPDDGATWQMQEYHNSLYQHWVTTKDPLYAAFIAQQWTYTKSHYTVAELGGNGAGITINASDDAGWVAEYLMQVYRVTGDPEALMALRSSIAASTRRFKDTHSTPITDGVIFDVPSNSELPFVYSLYGIQYKTSDQGYEGTIASCYEITLALAALFIVQETDGFANYARYVRQVYKFVKQYYRHPLSGCLYGSINLNPNDTSVSYLGPTKDPMTPLVEGGVTLNIQGTAAFGVLCARLYHAEPDPTLRAIYLADALSTIEGMVKPQSQWGFISTSTETQGGFLAWSDPWTDGHKMAEFAREVLTLPGADPDGKWAAAALITGRSIIAQRVSALTYNSVVYSGVYPADWGGKLLAPASNSLIASPRLSYEDQWIAVPGVQAGSPQIMTSSTTIGMLLAAHIIASWGPTSSPTPIATTNFTAIMSALATLGLEDDVLDWLPALPDAATEQYLNHTAISAGDAFSVFAISRIGLTAWGSVLALAATL